MAIEKNVRAEDSGREQSAHFTLNTRDPAFLARVRVVLHQPQHPGNIGAAARAMKTMGLSRLYLVRPQRFPDDEATARASGAADLLESATICPDLETALVGVTFTAALSARGRDIGPPVAPAREGALELARRSALGDVALLFGGETSGLANAEVMRCDLLTTIPTNPEYSSLNLGAAVQLMCYELRMAFGGGDLPAGKATPFESPPATRDEIENLFGHLERTMLATGFLNPRQPSRLLPKLRRMFGRGGLERDEVNILRGFLASVDALRGK
jgi:tRNA/rRNA methyltransferase